MGDYLRNVVISGDPRVLQLQNRLGQLLMIGSAIEARIETFAFLEVRWINAKEHRSSRPRSLIGKEGEGIKLGKMDPATVPRHTPHSAFKIRSIEAAINFVDALLLEAADYTCIFDNAGSIGPIQEKSGEAEGYWIGDILLSKKLPLGMPFIN